MAGKLGRGLLRAAAQVVLTAAGALGLLSAACVADLQHLLVALRL